MTVDERDVDGMRVYMLPAPKCPGEEVEHIIRVAIDLSLSPKGGVRIQTVGKCPDCENPIRLAVIDLGAPKALI